MGRRLITIVGIALAAASGVRPVPAQQANPPAARDLGSPARSSHAEGATPGGPASNLM